MIRVNLLAADRPSQKKSRAAGGVSAAPGALQAYLFLALFGGGAAVFCGFLWFVKEASIRELNTQIDAAKKRQLELQAIKAKVDEYEAQKRTLDAKISLIEKLQAQQSGPVHLLDEVSKALPEYVWLTSMDQTGGNVRFKGESNGLTAVADFISNLQRSGWFPRVDLTGSTQNAAGVVSFDLQAEFKNVAPEASPGAAAAAAKKP